MTGRPNEYDENVFINCPFDKDYMPIFEAVVFAVADCGFRPVCALERMNSGQLRIEKILDFIRDSRYSVHDISRTQPGKLNLPRFNMPLELGIALGCAKFGTGRQQRKTVLVLDARRFRFQRFMSDIAGQDIRAHERKPAIAVEAVRDWLRTESGLTDIPGAEFIMARYRRFRRDLKWIAAHRQLNPKRLLYADYCHLIRWWLTKNARPAIGIA